MRPQPRESRVSIDVTAAEDGPFPHLADDVRAGLARTPKELPPKYFYDARGAELFEQICGLPEYYLTRVERALLEEIADGIVALCRPRTLVEFGSGSARKTRILLDAMARRELLDLYVPIDVSERLLRQTAQALCRDYPGLQVHGVVGDFEEPVAGLPAGGPRLVAFLGSTIGNLTPEEAVRFLQNVARLLSVEDRFLLGTDLVKDTAVLEQAYNDAAGVTAAFNRNILAVINRHLGAHFDPGRFEHLAFYNQDASRIEMHLVARDAHQVPIDAIDLVVRFAKGESIRTEISCKYTRATVESMLATAGLRLLRWETDRDHRFGLSLSAVVQ